MKLQHLFSLALVAVSVVMSSSSALAVDPEQSLLADFPPTSIDSVERAEEALRRAPQAREEMADRYAREKAECLERFFAASCLSDMRSRERRAIKALKQIEVEARAFIRRERAAERERAVADRELRASQQAGKAIPYSGATRLKSEEQPAAEKRAPSKRIQIERVPGAMDDTAVPSASEAVSTPATSDKEDRTDGKVLMPAPEADGGAAADLAPDAGTDVGSDAGSDAPAADPVTPAEPAVSETPVAPAAPDATELQKDGQADVAPQPVADSLPVLEPLPVQNAQPMPEPQMEPETLPVSEPQPVLKPTTEAEPQPAAEAADQ